MASPTSLPQLSDIQKKTIEAVVNVFETGSPRGNYGAVTVLQGDSGHLTYGRSQATLAGGNLYILLRSYVNAPGAPYAAQVSAYLDRVERCDYSLDTDREFHALLRSCGEDHVMREMQDQFFDANYWLPAITTGRQLGLTLALSFCVLYDSYIQGGCKIIVEKTAAQAGAIGSQATEQSWIQAYVNTRKAWLTSRSALLAKTIYRMDAFDELIADHKWDLELPISFLHCVINLNDLAGSHPMKASADERFRVRTI